MLARIKVKRGDKDSFKAGYIQRGKQSPYNSGEDDRNTLRGQGRFMDL